MEMEAITPAPVETSAQATSPEPNQVLQQKVEDFRQKPPRERTARFLAFGRRLIEEKREDTSIFDSDAKKTQAEKALSYDGEEVNKASSDALKGMLDSIDQIPGEEAEGTRDELRKYVRVQVGDEEQLLTLDEWKEKLSRVTPDEAAALESQALYGFVFPENAMQTAQTDQEARASKPKTIVDTVIADYIGKIREEIDKLRGENKDVKSLERLVRTLENLGQKPNGKLAILTKQFAIQAIGNASGIDKGRDLWEAQLSVGQQLPEALRELQEHFYAMGITPDEFKEIQQNGLTAVEALIKSGRLMNDEGLLKEIFGDALEGTSIDELLKGTNLTPEQEELLRRYGKKGGLGVLLLLLLSTMGVDQVIKDLTGGR